MASGFLARQPILDAQLNTHGYELLFRGGIEEAFVHEDVDQATLSVLDTGFFKAGLSQITGGHFAFLNFTRYLLLHDFADVLPTDQVVIEILENVQPDAKVIEACYRLKNAGFRIALDDYQHVPMREEFLEIADMVKVDFMACDERARAALANLLLPMNVTLLAEKVETHEDYEEAVKLGYTFFQGYFFSKPLVLDHSRPPESRLMRLQLLKEVSRSEFDLDKAESFVKRDATLTLRLLRYINSAGMGVPNEVTKVRQALTLLGQKNLRKWLTVLVLSVMSEGKPSELMRLAVFRGRFCELLSVACGRPGEGDEFFFTGLFSLLDVVMDQSKESLLAEMPIPEAVKNALINRDDSIYANILFLVEAYEQGTWRQVERIARRHGLDERACFDAYMTALAWCDGLIQ